VPGVVKSPVLRIDVSPLAEGDVPAAVALLAAQLREHAIPSDDGHVESSLRGILAHPDQGIVLVAGLDERPAGVAYVSFARPLEHRGEVAWLEELYVSPESRGRGIGTRLLREAIARAEARGCVSLELEVKRGHERALNLYGREGFRDLERRHLARPLGAWDWR
jgi:GNAT superfamily N-acetyltransferase